MIDRRRAVVMFCFGWFISKPFWDVRGSAEWWFHIAMATISGAFALRYWFFGDPWRSGE